MGGNRIGTHQTFTETVKSLHQQFEKTGHKGAVRLDGNGFYVKGSSKAWDLNIAKWGKLQERFDKLNNAAKSLSPTIDREYGDLMVGDKTMSEYVMGDLLSSEGVHRIDEETLAELENRVLMGLNKAYDTALRRDDKATQQLLDSRKRLIGDGQNTAGAWRQLVEGHHLLRDAIATELRASPSFAQAQNFQGKPEDIDESYLQAYADIIITDAGVMGSGLTHQSIDKVLNHLENNYNADNSHSFGTVAALKDKAQITDNIAANVDRLSSTNATLQQIVEVREKNGLNDFSNANNVLNLLKASQDSIDLLNASTMQGRIYNDDTASAFATQLEEDATEILNVCRQEMRFNQAIKQNDLVLPENQNTDILIDLNNYAVMILSLAESLEAKTDYSGGMQDAENIDPRSNLAQDFDAVSSVSKDIDPLQQDAALNLFSKDGHIAQRLDEDQSIYKKEPDQNSNALSRISDVVQKYNIHLDSVQELFESYLANPVMKNLESLRGSLRSAIDSSSQILAHLKSVAPGKLQESTEKVAKDILLLDAQAKDLQKLDRAAGQTQQKLFAADGPAGDVYINVDPFWSGDPEKIAIPEDLPDFPDENSVQPADQNPMANDFDGVRNNISLPDDKANPTGMAFRARADSDISDDIFAPPEKFIGDIKKEFETVQLAADMLVGQVTTYIELADDYVSLTDGGQRDKLDEVNAELSAVLEQLMEVRLQDDAWEKVEALKIQVAGLEARLEAHTPIDVIRAARDAERAAHDAERAAHDAERAAHDADQIDATSEIESDNKFADEFKKILRRPEDFQKPTPGGPIGGAATARGVETSGRKRADSDEDLYELPPNQSDGTLHETPGDDSQSNSVQEVQSDADMEEHIALQRKRAHSHQIV